MKENTLFVLKDLKKCDTKEKVEDYFKITGVNEYEKRIEALTQATRSSQVDYFDSNIDIKKKYEALICMFLNKEFRFLRGL